MAATKSALWRRSSRTCTDAPGAPSSGMWGHQDQEEGPVAFTEKRDADWLAWDERDPSDQTYG